MSRLLDPKFKYVPAAKTNVGKTIRREQRRLQRAAELAAQRDADNQAEAARIVRPLKRSKP